MRTNPYIPKLYFRYGVWDINPTQTTAFHITPDLSAISESGAISPRSQRQSSNETLGFGGVHPHSISLYTDIEAACNALLYLYRFWQFYTNRIDIDFMRAHISMSDADWGYLSEKYINTDTHSLSQPKMRFRVIRKLFVEIIYGMPKYLDGQRLTQTNAQDPIVLSEDWLSRVHSETDFALIQFDSPCKYIFLDKIPYTAQTSTFPAFRENTNWQELTDTFCGDVGYFCGDSLPHSAFYKYLNLKYQQQQTDFDFKELIEMLDSDIPSSGTNWLYAFCFGYVNKIPVSMRTPIFKYKDITLDFRPQKLLFSDIGEYNAGEQELRVFRPIPTEEFTNIFSISQILEIATERNGGIEPLFWGQWETLQSHLHLKGTPFATWEDD